MFHSRIRRVLAASALAALVSLASVSSAGAAIRPAAHRGHRAASGIEAVGTRLRTLLVGALGKAGIRIDPNGLADGGH